MSIILFILLLTFLILIHELGHLFAARSCKVKIEEFGIGIPPKAATLFHWRGIPITLNWLPIGGFVKMEGEDAVPQERDEMSKSLPRRQAGKFQISKYKEYPFYTRKLWQKLFIVAAGPGVNFLFGVIVFTFLGLQYGIPVPMIRSVAPDSPAVHAGIQINDKFVDFTTNEELVTYLHTQAGKTISLVIDHNGVQKTVVVYVRKPAETPAGQGGLGVELSGTSGLYRYPFPKQLWRAGQVGLTESVQFGLIILRSVGGIGQSLIHGRLPEGVAGPVGIARTAEQEKVFSSGLIVALNFSALISINLAIMNLLPIPALDGGRAVLLILEKFFTGKRWQTLSANLNLIGLIFLVGLILVITVKDILGILLPH